MLNSFVTGSEKIFIACGYTDFRKQSNSLSQIVHGSFNLDPYNDSHVFTSAIVKEMPLRY